MEIAKPRPPFVVFELQAVEDRSASIAAGHYVAKDVAYAIVTPAGSKERYVKEALPWLAQLAQQVKEQRFPEEWYQHYKSAFAAWQAGHELPLNGTPLKTWPVLSPAQLQTLLGLNFRTVEDLANANEEGVMRLGMGGRTLKQRAVEWLQTASDVGKSSERNASLQHELAQAQALNATLREQNELLRSQLSAMQFASAAGLPSGGSGGEDPSDDLPELQVVPPGARKL